MPGSSPHIPRNPGGGADTVDRPSRMPRCVRSESRCLPCLNLASGPARSAIESWRRCGARRNHRCLRGLRFPGTGGPPLRSGGLPVGCLRDGERDLPRGTHGTFDVVGTPSGWLAGSCGYRACMKQLLRRARAQRRRPTIDRRSHLLWSAGASQHHIQAPTPLPTRGCGVHRWGNGKQGERAHQRCDDLGQRGGSRAAARLEHRLPLPADRAGITPGGAIRTAGRDRTGAPQWLCR